MAGLLMRSLPEAVMKRTLMTSVVMLAALAVAAPGYTGQRHGGAGPGRAVTRPGGPVGHAVPRSRVPVRPPIVGRYRSYGHYQYPYNYGPRFGLGLYYGYPGYYDLGHSWYGYPYYTYGYGSSYYGYGYGSPYNGYGYGYPGSVTAAPGQVYGRVRIQNAPRDAQVYVDGGYVGTVDNFDGARAGLTLEVGVHGIEIRATGFEPVEFDVNLQAGQTITYRARMRPLQP